MSDKFNVGKINVLDTEEKEDTPKDNKNSNEFKKKMLKLSGIILGGLILLLLILAVFSLFSKKDYSYDDIEEILKNAAISYFGDHKKSLPKDEEQVVEINSSTLIASEYMKEMEKYTGEDISCTGKVIVQKSGNDYSYTPYLNCGENYATQSLYQIVTKKTVNSGAGLYNSNNSYVFRGEDVKNYVELDRSLWRIVKITSDNKIVLVLNGEYNYNYPWDNRYNMQSKYNSGINQYDASRIRSYLNDIYKDNEDTTAILSSNDRTKLSSFNLCVGNRSTFEESKDNSIECSNNLSNQKIGLLTVSDYINASIDSNCLNSLSQSCQNYNYLETDFDWWLATSVQDSTDYVFYVDNGGVVKSESASVYAGVRPIVYLSDTTLFKSGKGTEKSPYKIK